MGYLQHGVRHLWFGTDPSVTEWVQVGTDGEDGVDDELAANPDPYQTGGTVGPPPFQNGMTNLDPDSGGLRYRLAPHGIQIDCGGGLDGVAENTIITTLLGVPPPEFARRGESVDVDGGIFTWELDTDLNLIYLAAAGDIDGGGP